MDKRKVITIIITLIGILILYINSLASQLYTEASTYYQVYLNGDKIGVIDDKEALYALIDSSGSTIKEEYNVDSVYPPKDFKIIEMNTYVEEIDNIEDIYVKIEEDDDFTIKGYEVTIKGEENNYSLYVTNKEVFYNAAIRFVNAFLNQDEYDNYTQNTQKEIEGTGRIIEDMNFNENISIKETYISIHDKIFTDELDLVQYLLFGDNPDTKSYTIKLGDTIESISNANELNVGEFLIANTQYKSENTILKVGEKVNVTLIDPQLTFTYTLKEVYDQEVYYQKEKVADDTQSTSYSEITTPGVNGIDRYLEEYTIENGVRSQGADPIKLETIKEVQNQITTYGTKSYYNGGTIQNTVNPVITSGAWGWPTNQGYVITSYRGWRWGRMHQGIDISGAGNFGSPIYAAADGTVEYVLNTCPSSGGGYGDSCGGSYGNQILINHGNGYTTLYAHLHQTILVSAGDKVTKNQKIGYMGNSGSSTGSHLHFEVKYNGENIDPLSIYQ